MIPERLISCSAVVKKSSHDYANVLLVREVEIY